MLNRLLSSLGTTDEEVPFEELSKEEQAEVLAEEKKQRVKFHRDSVRNGPVKWSHVTTGQQRRRAARDKAALQRKANKRHRRDFFRGQLHLATLRGQLQAIGAVSYATDYKPSVKQRIAAGQWLLGAFGERDSEGGLVLHDDALKDAVAAARETYFRQESKRVLQKMGQQ